MGKKALAISTTVPSSIGPVTEQVNYRNTFRRVNCTEAIATTLLGPSAEEDGALSKAFIFGRGKMFRPFKEFCRSLFSRIEPTRNRSTRALVIIRIEFVLAIISLCKRQVEAVGLVNTGCRVEHGRKGFISFVAKALSTNSGQLGLFICTQNIFHHSRMDTDTGYNRCCRIHDIIRCVGVKARVVLAGFLIVSLASRLIMATSKGAMQRSIGIINHGGEVVTTVTFYICGV